MEKNHSSGIPGSEAYVFEPVYKGEDNHMQVLDQIISETMKRPRQINRYLTNYLIKHKY